MLYFGRGSVSDSFDAHQLRESLWSALEQLEPRRKIVAVPPDVTRIHSFAGDLTRYAWQFYGNRLTDVLPAIGTHSHMTDQQMDEMFGDVPHELFRVHDWRHGVTTLGTVPAEFIREVSEGAVDYPWPAQVDRLLVEGGHDLILSFGQVVPHEVIGMANYNKNIFVGTGGVDSIHKSHSWGPCTGWSG